MDNNFGLIFNPHLCDGLFYLPDSQVGKQGGMMDNGGNGNLDKIAEKVKKLLALANHANTTEEEASTAMGMVQDILSKYNMTMSQVNASNGIGEKKENARTKDTLDKSAMYEYQRQLMNAIAKTHYCIYFVGKKWYTGKKDSSRPYHIVIGREANVITTKLMFEYLNGTIDRLVNKIYPPPINLSRSAMSWREGCSHRLISRLHNKKMEADQKQQEEAKKSQTSGTSTALVLLSQVRQNEVDLNWDFYLGEKPGTTALQRAQQGKDSAGWIPTSSKLSPEEQKKQDKRWEKQKEKWAKEEKRKWAHKDIGAYNDGYKKGGNIGLDTQVDNQDLTLKLK